MSTSPPPPRHATTTLSQVAPRRVIQLAKPRTAHIHIHIRIAWRQPLTFLPHSVLYPAPRIAALQAYSTFYFSQFGVIAAQSVSGSSRVASQGGGTSRKGCHSLESRDACAPHRGGPLLPTGQTLPPSCHRPPGHRAEAAGRTVSLGVALTSPAPPRRAPGHRAYAEARAAHAMPASNWRHKSRERQLKSEPTRAARAGMQPCRAGLARPGSMLVRSPVGKLIVTHT